MSINLVQLIMFLRMHAVADFDGTIGEPLKRQQAIPAGEKWAAGNAEIVGYGFRSNEQYPLVEFTTWVIHNLADPTDSDAYCSGEMRTDMSFALDRGNYEDITGVIEARDPVLSGPVNRIGNVMEWEAKIQMLLSAV